MRNDFESNVRYVNRAIWPVAAMLYILLPPEVLDGGIWYVVAHALNYLGYAAGAAVFIITWEFVLAFVADLFGSRSK